MSPRVQGAETAGIYASEAKGTGWVCRLLQCLGHTVCKCGVVGEGHHVAAEVTKCSWVSLRIIRKSAQGNGWLFLALTSSYT